MSAAVSTAIAAAAKRILAVLAGNKDGRRFLGYVTGIALFLVLLPVLALYGLFGWMSGNTAELIDRDKELARLRSCLADAARAEAAIRAAVTIQDAPVPPAPLCYAVITREGVRRLA